MVRAVIAVLGVLFAVLRCGPAAGLAALVAAALVILLDFLVRAGPSRGAPGVLLRALAGVGQVLAIAVLFFGPAPFGFGSTPVPVFILSPLLLLLICLMASHLDPQRPILVPIMAVACEALWISVRSFALAQPGTLSHARPGSSTQAAMSQLIIRVSGPHYFNQELWRNQLIYVLLIAGLLTATIWRSHRLGVVSARREAARNVLAAHFSPQVVETILKGGAESFRPRELEVAVLESDLVGFTSLAESLTPEETAEALSHYRRAVEQVVFAEDGAILAWTGDGATAVFGLEGAGGAAAAKALRCAQRLQQAWPGVAAGFPRGGQGLGVGVDFGRAVMGLVGEGRQVSLLLLGPPAAGAERLQAATREAGVRVLASAAAKAAAEAADAASVAGLSPTPLAGEAAWAF
jgi:adenylate cyclase